jgi:SepF-like predicted cell division protein (DUF552 family)
MKNNMVIGKIKEKLFGGKTSETEYIEIDFGQEAKKSKVHVQTFILKQFDDINNILNVIREGYTIAVIDISVLRSRDLIELKRAIAKLKKTVDALEGSIAGFGENIVIATPQFAEIKKGYAEEKREPKKDPMGW